MNFDERFTITLIAGALAIYSARFFLRRSTPRPFRLGLTTPGFTLLLIFYYWRCVPESAQGISILILPLTSMWLWWRREQTGKPALSEITFILLQFLFGLLYIMVVSWGVV